MVKSSGQKLAKKGSKRFFIILAIVILIAILVLPAIRRSASLSDDTKQNQSESIVPDSSNGDGPSLTANNQNSGVAYITKADQQMPITATQIGLPPSATVLALPGMDFHLKNDVNAQLGGLFTRSPYTFKLVDYPRSSSPTSISRGVSNLDAAIKRTAGVKIVFGYSQGAQVASDWMRQHANDPNTPGANELVFVLTGNPYRSTGGYGIGRKTWDGTNGQATPTDTRWHIIDIARRYEGWADWPNDSKNSWAARNANAGKKEYHQHYDVVNLFDAKNTAWTYRNTTYILTHEDLPMWLDKTNIPSGVKAEMQRYIETAYKRPANDPKVSTQKIGDWYWSIMLKIWGVK